MIMRRPQAPRVLVFLMVRSHPFKNFAWSAPRILDHAVEALGFPGQHARVALNVELISLFCNDFNTMFIDLPSTKLWLCTEA